MLWKLLWINRWFQLDINALIQQSTSNMHFPLSLWVVPLKHVGLPMCLKLNTYNVRFRATAIDRYWGVMTTILLCFHGNLSQMLYQKSGQGIFTRPNVRHWYSELAFGRACWWADLVASTARLVCTRHIRDKIYDVALQCQIQGCKMVSYYFLPGGVKMQPSLASFVGKRKN